jgi:hypothetical protein
MNLFKKLFSGQYRSNSRVDELIGFWENDADDGSGLHAIWGYGIEFLEKGKGFNHNWGSDIRPEDRKQEILWTRNSEKNISIKFPEEDVWTAIEYEISDFIGAYNSKYYKLVEEGKDKFWCAPNPIYKRK